MRELRLVGKRFGNWIVLERDLSKVGGTWWKCRCDCGTERSVVGCNLVSEQSKSCGCRWKPDTVGRHFGELIVISFIGKIGNDRAWLCHCNCGGEKVVKHANLIQGLVRSCGCLLVFSAEKARAKRKIQFEERFVLWTAGEINVGFSTARLFLLRLRGEKCEQCGWCKQNPINGWIPVQMDHIDGNNKNNKIGNVRFLCPNCHSLTPTFMNLNKSNLKKLRLQTSYPII